MSAGQGVMHAEMPVHRDAAGKKLPDPVGLQLWLDLPEANKKDPPTYQEFPKEEVPLALPRADKPEETEGKGWSIKVIAGQSRECFAIANGPSYPLTRFPSEKKTALYLP